MRVRPAIADFDAASEREEAGDRDYCAALVHGRRSRMAEGPRLAALCRIQGLQEFTRTVFPGPEMGLVDFQRRSAGELVRELSALREHLPWAGSMLLGRVLVRFRVENLKIFIRACLARPAVADISKYLVPLPKDMALDDQGMAAAESIDGLIPLVPKGVLRESLKEALETYRDHPGPFFLEAALDRGYFQGLLAGVEALPREDREIVTPMVRQEVDIFHLMLLLRGRFHYGLARELLLPLHVAGAGISRALFIEMLDAQDLHACVDRAAGWVFDGTPPEDGSKSGSETAAFDAAAFERLAWKRFLRLANLAFRRSHMGLGAVIGYAGVRRMETANLITISEGVRKGMDGATILARLIAPPGPEAIHV